jgi:tetratricopeptide (TPR) repeat protein
MIVTSVAREGLETDTLADLEVYVRRGEFVKAQREAERLMLLPDLTPREMGRLFRLSGRARSESGDPYGGLKVLELAIPWALKAKDWDCAGKARAELGISWLLVGDIPNAIDNFRAYLLDLHRYDEAATYLGHVHYNLGIAYRYRKDYDQAVSHYREALEWFTQRGYTLQAGETLQNLTWLYCMKGDTVSADESLTLAETYARVCGPEFKVEQILCRALLLKTQRQIQPALQLAQELLEPGRPQCTTSQKAYAAWIVGSIALSVWNVENAWYFANLAIKHALNAKNVFAMSQASALRAEVYRRKQSAEEAAG